MQRFLHNFYIPRVTEFGIIFVRACHKGRLGYRCHGRPGECN